MRFNRQLVLVVAALAALAGLPQGAQGVRPPQFAGSLRFSVIGDNGSGERPQFEVGAQMEAARAVFPFDLVLMVGDNLYGRQKPADFLDKFERPYAALRQAGIQFQAVLGNHDNPTNVAYPAFNMNGARYYSFARGPVRFFMFDTNLLDPQQLTDMEAALRQATEPWRIACFHHPLYSDAGRHGSNVELRVVLEPLLVRYGVSVVFAGHEHVYQRTVPQKGITHFVEGASGQLRRGDMRPTSMTAASYDQDRTFMLVEIAGDQLVFQTLSRTGQLVDAGVIHRRNTGADEERPRAPVESLRPGGS